ncbi:unnamed protein product [Arabidopsis thaliana]|uniref:MATH domain-containing protein n=1 Tax=Arabidopsis thaliana TaxID=3702 RepID=A0A5S9WPG7_ARATH|nr:unnamed protein product [Arabidopsis thaliana]
MGSKASDSAMLKTWRRNPPSSSLVRLSQLANDKYESPPFSSGGHNWRLVVYPKGNEADNGRGFVSMYVECLSSTTPPIDVFAYLTFFVFSEEEKRYLSIQDVEVKRFNSSKTVWGLSQVLPVETLKDRAKGFILSRLFHNPPLLVKFSLFTNSLGVFVISLS